MQTTNIVRRGRTPASAHAAAPDLPRRALLWGILAWSVDGLPFVRTHKALAFGAGVAAGPFVEASSLGLRGDPTADQTDALRSALETAARRKAVLRLPKGIVRVTDLDMSGPVRIAGRPGASLQATDRATYVISVTDGPVWMHGVHMDGRFAGHRDGPALLEVRNASEVLLDSCTIRRGKGNLVNLEKCRGEVRNCLLEKAFTAALFALDCKDFRIVRNHVRRCGDNGILVWQSRKRRDGALVAHNLVEDIRADSGGDGPNGNGINIYRANEVRVLDNVIRRCAFTAVRNNAGNACVISRNEIHDMGEVAIFVEFAYQGAVVSDNVIDLASAGISVTNLDNGGRLATVSGNVIRNVRPRIQSVDVLGYGIGAEGDVAVTGNVVENASESGITVGWGPYLRNVAVTGNVLRHCGVGIAISVVSGAGPVVITGNMIAQSAHGAVVGYDHASRVTGDLLAPGAQVPAHITLSGNRSA